MPRWFTGNVSNLQCSPLSIQSCDVALCAKQVVKYLSVENVPYIAVGSSCGASPAAALKLKKDISSAAVLAERCVAHGVKTAWIATYATCESRTSKKKLPGAIFFE